MTGPLQGHGLATRAPSRNKDAMIWTVPNMLTLGRLVAAPGVVVPFMALPRPEADAWALAIFLVAAATDWLDGRLARAWGQESALGRVLDPIADKAIVVVAVAVLLALHGAPAGPAAGQAAPLWWLAALPMAAILFREVLVTGLREAVGPGAGLSVTRLAKWKTTAQMVAIAILFAAEPAGRTAADSDAGVVAAQLAGLALLWVAAVLTVVTGADYTAKALRYIRAEEGR